MYSDLFKSLDKIDKTEQTIILEPISSDAIKDFNVFYRELTSIVENIIDSQLNNDLISLKRFFDNMKKCMIPYELMATEHDYEKLNQLFERILLFKDSKEIEEFLISFGKVIGNIKRGNYHNVLPDKIIEILNNYSNSKIAIIHYNWPPNIGSPFQADVTFLKFNQYLTTNVFYDVAIFIGSPNYFSLHYNLATSIQRAEKIYYVYFDIYSSKFNKTFLINDNHEEFSRIYNHYNIIYNADLKTLKEVEEEQPIEFYESTEVLDVLKDIIKENVEERTIPSYVYELMSRKMIIYPENGTIHVLDKNSFKVSKNNASKVKEGQWIVIKSNSERDYIDEKAAEILGEDYYTLYRDVTSYKKLLSDKIEELGSLRTLEIELQLNGISTTQQLLKNWIFGDTIAPEIYRNLLRYLGFGEKDIDYLHKSARKIVTARQSAGRTIMENINKFIAKYDVNELLREIDTTDSFEFELPNTGTFIIETIKRRLDETVEVESKHLYRLFDIEKNTKNQTYGIVKKFII